MLFMSIASLAAGAVAAQAGIEIERSVYIERAERDGNRIVRALEPAYELRRGDSVVLMLNWSAAGRSDSFTVSSRVPRDLAYQRSGGHEPEVSIDGGKSWGHLTKLRTGSRKASPEDVTHLRWQVSNAQAALGRGVFSYSAIVR